MCKHADSVGRCKICRYLQYTPSKASFPWAWRHPHCHEHLSLLELLCLQVRCPVNINTGEFTKQLRTAAIEGLDAAAGAASASTSSSWGSKLSLFAANHFKLISIGAPALLNTVHFFHGCVSHAPIAAIDVHGGISAVVSQDVSMPCSLRSCQCSQMATAPSRDPSTPYCLLLCLLKLPARSAAFVVPSFPSACNCLMLVTAACWVRASWRL
jgi:hypothetical protein